MTTSRTTSHRSAAPGARFIDPIVLSRIDNLELVARTVVEGFIGGLHRSPHLGLSVDFAEHRPYMPGDDIRRIDWRVFARTDRHYVKEFEADSNANFMCLLDVSRSMDFSSRPGEVLTKLDYARYLAACLTYFAHKQRDRVGLVTFDHEVVDYVPPSAKHLDVALHAIDRVATRRAVGELAAPLAKVTEASRRKGILVLVSDLYEEPRTVLRALTGLIGRGHDLVVFHLLDPAEVHFDVETAANFEDLESGEAMPVIPEDVRAEYRRLVAEHVDELTTLLGQNRVDYRLIETATPLDEALFAYLSMRQKATRVR